MGKGKISLGQRAGIQQPFSNSTLLIRCTAASSPQLVSTGLHPQSSALQLAPSMLHMKQERGFFSFIRLKGACTLLVILVGSIKPPSCACDNTVTDGVWGRTFSTASISSKVILGQACPPQLVILQIPGVPSCKYCSVMNHFGKCGIFSQLLTLLI